METAAVIIGDWLGTDESTSLQIFFSLIAILLTTLIFVLILFCRRSAKKSVYIAGISDSGKTLMFSHLINKGKTNPETVASQTTNFYDQFNNEKGNSLNLIDIPGADKIRTTLLANCLSKFKPAGLIFVVDSSTIQKDCREVAEFFYSILADYPEFCDRRNLPILVACNKQDLSTCKSAKTVKLMLEKEFSLLNRTRSAALGQTDSYDSKVVKNKRILGSSEFEFNFEKLAQKFCFVECTTKSNTENPSDLSRVFDWMAMIGIDELTFVPLNVVKHYQKQNLHKLFKWQYDCLKNALESASKNSFDLVLHAPTSSGKSLIAEILILIKILPSLELHQSMYHDGSRLACDKVGNGQIFDKSCQPDDHKRALYVLPFVSISREKFIHLQASFRDFPIKIDGFFGSCFSGSFDSTNLAICTIERANNLINKLIECKELHKLSMIIIDEFHYVGDRSRGYLLELIITKLIYYKRIMRLDLQILCMTATASNAKHLAENWLGANFFCTNQRPTPLYEYLFSGLSFYKISDGNEKFETVEICHKLGDNLASIPSDPDHVIGLALETVLSGHGVLIFCSTKSWCEKLASTLSNSIQNLMKSDDFIGNSLKRLIDFDRQLEFFSQYKIVVRCVDKFLANTLKFAVAFHHAGLTVEEREQIERGFEVGVVKILVATSTLCSGVNLPAKRVIIRSPWGSSVGAAKGPRLTPTSYRQMIGRAGRFGKDDYGESILICKENEFKRGLELCRSENEAIKSSLGIFEGLEISEQSASRSKRTVLEAIASGMTVNAEEVATYLKCTLAYCEKACVGEIDMEEKTAKVAQSCISYLLANEFIQNENDGTLKATQLGSASLSSCLPPDEALSVFADLQNAQKNLALDSDMHMLYLVTPHQSLDSLSGAMGGSFHWSSFYNFYTTLCNKPCMKTVCHLIGISESFLARVSRFGLNKLSCKSRDVTVHLRFYAALILSDLINEMPLDRCALKFGLNRGYLQNLQQQSSTYAGMMVNFCDRLGWYYLKLLLDGFSERIAYGIRRELTELVAVDGLDGSRARIFHENGLATISNLACCQTHVLKAILRKAVPFESKANKLFKPEILKRPWLANYPDLLEDRAVEILQKNARKILQEKSQFLDFGVLINVKIQENLEMAQKPEIDEHSKMTKDPKIAENLEKYEIKQISDELLPIACSTVQKQKLYDDCVCIGTKINIAKYFCNESFTKIRSFSFSSDDENLASDVALKAGKVCQNSKDCMKDLNQDQLDDLLKDFTDNSPKIDFLSSCRDFDELAETLNSLSMRSIKFDENEFAKISDASMMDDQEIFKLVQKSPDSCESYLLDNTAADLFFEKNLESSQNSSKCDDLICCKVYTSGISGQIVQECMDLNESAINFFIDSSVLLIDFSDEFKMNLHVPNDNNFWYEITPFYNNKDKCAWVDWMRNFLHRLFSVCHTTETKTVVLANAKNFLSFVYTHFEVIFSWKTMENLHIFCVRTALHLLDFTQFKENHISDQSDSNIRSIHRRYISLENQVNLENLSFAFKSIESRVLYPVWCMETFGLLHCLDYEFLTEISGTLRALIGRLESQCFRLAGRKFCLNSSKEVAQILFVVLNLKLPVHAPTVTQRRTVSSRGKHYSTNRQVLECLENVHPLPKAISMHRRVSHAFNACVVPLQSRFGRSKNHSSCKYDLFTATGRMIMFEPSFQSLPKKFHVKIDEDVEIVNLRDIIKAKPGHVLVAFDYCQIELRILAHFSQDSKLLAIFSENFVDVFKLIAAQYKRCPVEDLSEEDRQTAKQICYGIIYGIGSKKLAEQLKIDVEQSVKFINDFKRTFPGIVRCIDDVISKCRMSGFVQTLTNRRRYLPDIGSDPRARGGAERRAQAERQAFNTKIQGSAADIFKMALLCVQQELTSVFGENYFSEYSWKFILQMHDEILLQFDERIFHQAIPIVKSCMENCYTLNNVNLMTKCKAGPTWGHLEDFTN